MAIAQTRSMVLFDSLVTNLATNTTLGTATRHDFAAKTLYVPETASRTFRSVIVRGSAILQGNAAGLDLDGVRIGIKIGAVAFDDVDLTYTVNHTGEQWCIQWSRDVTAYFVANDPGTASFSVQVGVAFATGAASNVSMVTAHVEAAYDFDDAAATLVGVLMIPIQSHHANLSGAYHEVGSSGGVGNAPTNQIPQLTGVGGILDGVTGATIRSSHLIVHGKITPASTPVFQPIYRFDGVNPTYARCNIDPAASTALTYIDLFDLGAGGANLSTTAAHAFEVHPGTNNNLAHMGAILAVVYEYTASSNTQLVSVAVPLDNGADDGSELPIGPVGTVTADAHRFTATLDIQEPGAITLLQSGVVIYSYIAGNGPDLIIGAPGQTERSYDHQNIVRDTGVTLIQRCDHSGSNWALARGTNKLHVDWYGTTPNQTPINGYALVNYRCGKPAGGAAKKNRTVSYQVISHDAAQLITTQTPTAPAIPEANYAIVSAAARVCPWVQSGQVGQIGAERQANEASGKGWLKASSHTLVSSLAELSSSPSIVSVPWFKRGGEVDVETSRRWQYHLLSTWHPLAELWLTYHAITFTVAGTVTVNGAPAPDGGSFAVWAFDAAGAEKVAADVLSNGNGTFSVEVPDDTRSYLVTFTDGAVAGSSLVGTPETSTFNITIGGGGNTTPPTVTVVSPTPGVAPGQPGGFPADWETAKDTPIVVNITDVAPGLEYLCLTARFGAALEEIVIYRRGAFRGRFAAQSTITPIANGYQLSILPVGGWPEPADEFSLEDLTFAVDAIDGDGNLAP